MDPRASGATTTSTWPTTPAPILVLGTARGTGPGFFGARLGVGGHIKYREFDDGLSDTTADGFLFYHPVPTFGWQSIGEAHAALWLGPLMATLEGGYAREERSKAEFGALAGQRIQQAPIDTYGGALEVAWMIWGEHRVSNRWPGDQQFIPDAWTRGSLEVAARIERVDLEANAADVKPGGAEGFAAAVNWWATSFTALSLAAYDYHYFANPIEEPTESSSWLVLARVTASFR